jgi:hypothetical protein
MSSGTSPADFIERCRLASDPVKHLHVIRLREVVARWLEAGSFERPRDLRASRVPVFAPGAVFDPTKRETAWCLELFESDRLVAHEIRFDHDDALAHALEQVGAS